MNKIKYLSMMLLASISMLIAPSAFAESILANTTAKFGATGILVVTVGIVVGVFTTMQGIYHFKKSAHDSLRYPMSEGITTLLTGVAMVGFVFVYAVIRGTIRGNDDVWNDGGQLGGLALSNTIQEINESSNSFMGQVLGNDMMSFIFGILWIMGLILFFAGVYSFKLAGAAEAKTGGYVKKALTLLLISFILLNLEFSSCVILSVLPGDNAFYCQG